MHTEERSGQGGEEANARDAVRRPAQHMHAGILLQVICAVGCVMRYRCKLFGRRFAAFHAVVKMATPERIRTTDTTDLPRPCEPKPAS